MRVRWTEPATNDLFNQTDYVAASNPAMARRVGLEIRRLVRGLEDFPYRGRPGRSEGTREFVLPGLPWIAIYEIQNDEVMILHLIHGAQDWPPQD